MTEQLDWVPSHVDMDTPSAARMYDYLLGGGHNFEADRVLVDKILAAQPNARTVARANRDFLRRAVNFMLANGVRQFLDLGSGIPTVGNVHEIALRIAPESRVVYVDFEDVAVAHSQLILEDTARATIVQADVTRPEDVLNAPETTTLLDFDQPVGVLMLALLHFVGPDRDPVGAIRKYQSAMAPGSWLGITHFDSGLLPEANKDALVELMRNSANPAYPRSRAEITELFGDFELAEPGLVAAPLWRPEVEIDEAEANGVPVSGGVGRKP